MASAVEFFVFEVPKVLLLLTLVVFVVGILRSFFTPEKTRSLLADRRETAGNVLASLLGIVTPFCSCSAVPMFIGFVTAGVPLGVTFSYLVAAPMVNEIALAVLIGIPMYSNAAGLLPVVQALLGKGAALGTVLAFMMSVIALSLPEMVILRKVLTPRLIAVFVSIVGTGILLVGFLFNAVL